MLKLKMRTIESIGYNEVASAIFADGIETNVRNFATAEMAIRKIEAMKRINNQESKHSFKNIDIYGRNLIYAEIIETNTSTIVYYVEEI